MPHKNPEIRRQYMREYMRAYRRKSRKPEPAPVIPPADPGHLTSLSQARGRIVGPQIALPNTFQNHSY